jgi:hypothetical protein
MSRLPRRTAYAILIVAVILSTATLGMTEALASNGKGSAGEGTAQGQASQGKGDGSDGSQQGASSETETQDDGPGDSGDGSGTSPGGSTNGNGNGNGPAEPGTTGNGPAENGTDAPGASGSGNRATGPPAGGGVSATPLVAPTEQVQEPPVEAAPGLNVTPAMPVEDEPGERLPGEAHAVAAAPPTGRIVDPAPPAHEFGVLALAARGLGPALAASQAVELADHPEAAAPQGSTGFVAGFRILAEVVDIDLTANAALGLLLLWLSLRRIDGLLPKARVPQSPASHDD